MASDYHAKYFAHKLTLTDNDDNRLDRALFDASVDLNPHQIEAALFALKSPSKGVILADEVGLGKTIEAGLVICQSWAERRRSILISCPASLRKQWEFELRDKFNIPAVVLDAKTMKELISKGMHPWNCGKVIICSLDFCAKQGDAIKRTAWDLVVIDEAHRLRNVKRKTATAIRQATSGYKKILLTATPLQNKLEDLYGLSTLIDEQLFGSLEAFSEQYKKSHNHDELRERLNKFCKRTLRSEVEEFIKFTNRKPITVEFTPSEKEHELYERISRFLQRREAYSLPRRQKQLLTLIVRKQLASSPHAIIKTLETMRNRLVMLLNKDRTTLDEPEKISFDRDDCDLWTIYGEGEEEPFEKAEESSASDQEREINPHLLREEIEELNGCLTLLKEIEVDTKLNHLKQALQTGFSEMEKLGAARKAVIFTESRRTQEYLARFLKEQGYGGKIVLFNGTNQDRSSADFYTNWLTKDVTKERISGSKPIDIRTALIETFRDEAELFIATEAAAEGINLQFCSLVINYDLPWNPQRIEQRIGRCHRYGQKHDVVVINFLNQRNHADKRVYELLSEKFHLFSGVFGVSDEVLGSIIEGVEFEKRILEICQSCRTPQEIDVAMAKLREELKEPLNAKLAETRRKLLEHFDYDIHAKFKHSVEGARDRLSQMEKIFWRLSKQLLKGRASFDDETLTFQLTNSPLREVSNSRYHLIQRNRESIAADKLYRLSHPLAEYLIKEALHLACSTVELTFHSSSHPVRIAAVEHLRGKHGWLSLHQLTINAFTQRDYLLFAGFDCSGRSLDMDSCEKLFLCEAEVTHHNVEIGNDGKLLQACFDRIRDATIARNGKENSHQRDEKEMEFDRWAQDRDIIIEKEIRLIKDQIQRIQRAKRLAETIEEKKKFEMEQLELERKKKAHRREQAKVEDETSKVREERIAQWDAEERQKTNSTHLFTIRWRVI